MRSIWQRNIDKKSETERKERGSFEKEGEEEGIKGEERGEEEGEEASCCDKIRVTLKEQNSW